MSQFKIKLGSQEASNVDINATWKTLAPKLAANKNLWSPNHQTLAYRIFFGEWWCPNKNLWSSSHQTVAYQTFFVMNDGAPVNNCNL